MKRIAADNARSRENFPIIMDDEDSNFRKEEEPRKESKELSMESKYELGMELQIDQQLDSPLLFSHEPKEITQNDIKECSSIDSSLDTTFGEQGMPSLLVL